MGGDQFTAQRGDLELCRFFISIDNLILRLRRYGAKGMAMCVPSFWRCSVKGFINSHQRYLI
uniref:Uncharacterized protein n=1 Tax=Leersia perrieri TaxID=77586 RepID=A0A0D9VXH5_9ORYZ